MKTNEVRPETFIQGVGQSEDMPLYGLTYIAATEEDVLASVDGLGQLRPTRAPKRAAPAKAAQPASTMDRIVRGAVALNVKSAAVQSARAKLAASNPVAALRVQAEMKRTAAPGSNVAKGIRSAMNDAAKIAVKAKRNEAEAKKLLAQSDKRGAAAKAINALQDARRAMTLATKAEKTRLTTTLDKTAHTLEAQANYIEGVVRNEAARGGQTQRTTALMANTQMLRQEAKRLRNQSAVVQTVPDVPPNAPSEQRIADVANKFNIRTAGRAKFDRRRAIVSVLSDLADDPMAQVKDYDGALSYYGSDDLGRLAADMEFDNYDRALEGLARGVHGLGQANILPVFSEAQEALNSGVAMATRSYADAVIPAYVGNQPRAVAAMQSTVKGLMGLGALGQHKRLFMEPDSRWFGVQAPDKNRGEKWDRWCRENIKDPAQLQKCMNPGLVCDALEPWSAAGKLCRGLTDIAGAAAQVGKDIFSGKAKIELPKVTTQNPTPPADTKPPAVVPDSAIPQGAQQAMATATASGGASTYSMSKMSPTMMAVYGVGAVAVLGAAWMVFKPKQMV